MKIDPIPDNRNRIAYTVGLIFHPAVIGIPTLLMILQGFPFLEIARWIIIIIGILVVPGFFLVKWYQRQDRYVYQRQTRKGLYLTAWLCTLFLLGVLIFLHAPEPLIVCTLALIVWVPLQLAVNQYVTKISTHVAVATGCAMGLLLLGKLPGVLMQVLTCGIIILIAWSRMVTRNHTLTQVLLGAILGGGVVLLVFPLLLR